MLVIVAFAAAAAAVGVVIGFLFDMPAASEVDVVIRQLVMVHNLRLKVNRLAEAAEQLAQFGPMKPPEQQGLDDSTPLLEDYDTTTGLIADRKPPTHGANYRPDPSERRVRCTHHRTNHAPAWARALPRRLKGPDPFAAGRPRMCADAEARGRRVILPPRLAPPRSLAAGQRLGAEDAASR